MRRYSFTLPGVQNKVTGTLQSGLEPGPFVTPPFSGFSEFHIRDPVIFLAVKWSALPRFYFQGGQFRVLPLRAVFPTLFCWQTPLGFEK